jgi:hypothetical protein
MKRNTLQMLVAMALGQLYMAEQSNGGEEKKPLVTIPEKVGSWHDEGKKVGKRVHDAIEKGEMLAREALLVYAEHLATEHDTDGNLPPSATDWLNGYVSAWSNPNTQKARKTEAKAVFDAFAMRGEERELTVGVTTPAKDSKESPQPIKEVHTVGEWLKQHQDVKGREGYRGLVDFAKELRGAASGRGAGGGANRGPRTVTAKQQQEIEARVEVMSPNQAHTIAQRATAQLAKLPQFEEAMFRQIVNSSDMILNKSTDEGCKKRAQAIRDMAEDMVEKLKAARAATASTTSITGTKGAGPITAPAPAQTPVTETGGPAPAQGEQKAA